MKLPKSFIKEKSLGKKVQELLNKTERDAPGKTDCPWLTGKIYEYLELDPGKYSNEYPYIFYGNTDYEKMERIKENVEILDKKNYKILRDLEKKLESFEKKMNASSLDWKLISKQYSEEKYKKIVKEKRILTGILIVQNYSKAINFIPGKIAKYFFNKEPKYSKTYYDTTKDEEIKLGSNDILGTTAYISALLGETVIVELLTGFGITFLLSALITGVAQIFTVESYSSEELKKHRKFIKEYKKLNKNSLIRNLREEKKSIQNFIEDKIC